MGCDNRMLNNQNEIFSACEHIRTMVSKKSKEEVNPLLLRIQYIIQEFWDHFLALSKGNMNKLDERYHWSVLYRVGDTLDEMAILLNNTTPVFIQTEVEYIKQRLVFFTSRVVQTYGIRNSLYIITPKFQELAGLW